MPMKSPHIISTDMNHNRLGFLVSIYIYPPLGLTLCGCPKEISIAPLRHGFPCHAICFKARSLVLSSILEIPKWGPSTFCHCVLCFIVYYKKEKQ